jgi:hypothetical protein
MRWVHVCGSRSTEFKKAVPVLTVADGAILGFLVKFTSIGAGALGAVMLLYLYPIRLNGSSLVGTDIAHAIPLTLLAGIGHLLLGYVNGQLLVNLLLGSIPGIALGSFASTHGARQNSAVGNFPDARRGRRQDDRVLRTRFFGAAARRCIAFAGTSGPTRSSPSQRCFVLQGG